MQEQSSPPVRQSETKTIVLFGTTQSGKSSFLKFIYQYAGLQPPPELLIGNGTLSCTSETRLYTLGINYVQFVTRHELDQSQSIFENICKAYEAETSNRAAYRALDIKFRKKPIRLTTNEQENEQQSTPKDLILRVIDTPGLDDSQNRDEMLLIDILQSIQDAQSITAIVFIISKTNPFTGTFQRIFSYYRALLPDLASRFFIIHSCYSLEDHFTTPSFPRTRKAVFNQLFEPNVENSTTMHMFFNSVIDTTLFTPSECQLEMAWSYRNLTQLLVQISGLSNLLVGQIYYVKSPEMRAKENMLQIAVTEKINGYKSGIELLDAELSEVATDLSNWQSQDQINQGTMKLLKRELEEIDTDENELIGTDKQEIGPGFSNFFGASNEIKLQLKTDKDIDSLNLWHPSTCKTKEPATIDTTHRIASASIVANYMRWAIGSLSAYAKKRKLYSSRISQLRLELEACQQKQAEIEAEKRRLSDKKNARQEKVEEMSTYISKYSSAIQFFIAPKYKLEWYIVLNSLLQLVKINETPQQEIIDSYIARLLQLVENS